MHQCQKYERPFQLRARVSFNLVTLRNELQVARAVTARGHKGETRREAHGGRYTNGAEFQGTGDGSRSDTTIERPSSTFLCRWRHHEYANNWTKRRVPYYCVKIGT